MKPIKVPKSGSNNAGCCSSHKAPKLGRSGNNNGPLEGELMKIGKKSEMFVNRYYVLRDTALLCYKSKGSKVPSGTAYFQSNSLI